jgi:DNA-binding MarR family transcriptional regulator
MSGIQKGKAMSQAAPSNCLDPIDSRVIEILLSLGPMTIPDRSLVAISNRLGCSTATAWKVIKRLEERGLIELISDFGGSLSDAPIRSSWRWRVPPDYKS